MYIINNCSISRNNGNSIIKIISISIKHTSNTAYSYCSSATILLVQHDLHSLTRSTLPGSDIPMILSNELQF